VAAWVVSCPRTTIVGRAFNADTSWDQNSGTLPRSCVAEDTLGSYLFECIRE
jgi:hypothetical protein